MDGAYLKAAVPEPCQIFGLRLLPLSIGRFRLLERFECGFVNGAPQVGMEDLLLGILICSMPVGEFLEFIAGQDCHQELARWGEFIREEMERDQFNVFAKAGLFRAYLDAAVQAPDFWDESEGQREPRRHWLQNLEVTLRTELNYTTEEIEEGPLSKALLDAMRYAESQGSIRIISLEEIEQGAANTALLESILKGGTCPASN